MESKGAGVWLGGGWGGVANSLLQLEPRIMKLMTCGLGPLVGGKTESLLDCVILGTGHLNLKQEKSQERS